MVEQGSPKPLMGVRFSPGLPGTFLDPALRGSLEMPIVLLCL